MCVRLSADKEGDCTSGHCSQCILGLHVVRLFLLHCGPTATIWKFNYYKCRKELCQLWSCFLILLSSGLGECSSLSCCRSCVCVCACNVLAKLLYAVYLLKIFCEHQTFANFARVD